jgi:hypothetical protein
MDYGVGTCIARGIQVVLPDGSKEYGSVWKMGDHHYARVGGLNYVLASVEQLTVIALTHGDGIPVYQGFSVDADLEKGFEGY